jgi:hypothetical protein
MVDNYNQLQTGCNFEKQILTPLLRLEKLFLISSSYFILWKPTKVVRQLPLYMTHCVKTRFVTTLPGNTCYVNPTNAVGCTHHASRQKREAA